MLKVAVAQVPGPHHIQNSTNRQDMYGWVFRALENGGVRATVVLTDGGTPGKNSEVGAGEIAQNSAIKLDSLVNVHGYKPKRIAMELNAHIMKVMRDMVENLEGGAEYLHRLDEETRRLAQLGRPAQLSDFYFDVNDDLSMKMISDWVQDNLLFTYVAVVSAPEGAMVFQRGDGGTKIDGELYVEDYNNVNPYFGYALTSPKLLFQGDQRLQSQGFDLTRYRSAAFEFLTRSIPGAKKVALFSDGMPLDHIDVFFDYVQPIDRQGRNKAQVHLRKLLRQSMLQEEVFVLEAFMRRPMSEQTRNELRKLVEEVRAEANVKPLINDNCTIIVLCQE